VTNNILISMVKRHKGQIRVGVQIFDGSTVYVKAEKKDLLTLLSATDPMAPVADTANPDNVHGVLYIN